MLRERLIVWRWESVPYMQFIHTAARADTCSIHRSRKGRILAKHALEIDIGIERVGQQQLRLLLHARKIDLLGVFCIARPNQPDQVM